MRRRVALVCLAVAAVVAAGGCDPAAWNGPTVHPVPAGGVFVVDGHSWGHGVGMSQWGAQGAASRGVPAGTILATYYPGTSRGTVGNDVLRVWLQRDDGTDLTVEAAEGLAVTDLSTGRVTPLPAGPVRWRAVRVGTAMRVQGLSGATWTDLAGSVPTPGPLRFAARAGFVGVRYPGGLLRWYRGTVQATLDFGGFKSVANVRLEDYVSEVVPQEVSPSWAPAALQAQAVAARTFAVWYRSSRPRGSSWDVCDNASCQAFGGVGVEQPSTTTAVRATAGWILTYGRAPAVTMYSASSGGWTVAGGAPYLPAHADDWDGWAANPQHSWSATLPATAIQRAFPAVGRLLRLRVSARDGGGQWGGRVKTVVLEGVDARGAPSAVTTTGAAIYNLRPWPTYPDGLRSSWWNIR
ncbi:MAG: SpoIID/LytB domain-containing protein [Frankiaceae bacterium]